MLKWTCSKRHLLPEHRFACDLLATRKGYMTLDNQYHRKLKLASGHNPTTACQMAQKFERWQRQQSKGARAIGARPAGATDYCRQSWR